MQTSKEIIQTSNPAKECSMIVMLSNREMDLCPTITLRICSTKPASLAVSHKPKLSRISNPLYSSHSIFSRRKTLATQESLEGEIWIRRLASKRTETHIILILLNLVRITLPITFQTSSKTVSTGTDLQYSPPNLPKVFIIIDFRALFKNYMHLYYNYF